MGVFSEILTQHLASSLFFLVSFSFKDICGFCTFARNAVPADANVICAEGMFNKATKVFRPLIVVCCALESSWSYFPVC